jgi:hypothetical protein
LTKQNNNVKIELEVFKEQLEKMKLLDYGSIKFQVRDSKVTLITVEKTIRTD